MNNMQQFLRDSIKTLIVERQNKELPSLYFRDDSNINLNNMYNVLAIIWPRRAWKTSFMYQLIHQLINNWIPKNDILFIDFENYRLLELQTKDVWELLTIFYELYGHYPKYIFFDEIQKLENRWNVIRTFHDDWYNIIISWSSSKLLMNEINTELRWRYTQKLMLPFSFKEIVAQNNIETKNIEHNISQRSKIINLFDKYIEFWGFPLVVKEEDEEKKRELLEWYYETIFYRDILERHNIQDKKAMEYLMKYSLNMYSSILSITKFEQYLKTQWINISKATLLKYEDYLKEAFFKITCQKLTQAPKWEIINPNKNYLIDPWFIKLWNNYSKNGWKILENIVAIELFRNSKNFYYIKDKKECDFVIKDKINSNFLSAIQVTRTLDIHNEKREIEWLEIALEKCKLKEWFILTYNEFDEIEKDWKKIHVMPVWKRILL